MSKRLDKGGRSSFGPIKGARSHLVAPLFESGLPRRGASNESPDVEHKSARVVTASLAGRAMASDPRQDPVGRRTL